MTQLDIVGDDHDNTSVPCLCLEFADLESANAEKVKLPWQESRNAISRRVSTRQLSALTRVIRSSLAVIEIHREAQDVGPPGSFR